MSNLDHAKTMFRLAGEDLKAVRNMMDPNAFHNSIFGFHAQQAAEKALKAWLSLRGLAYPHTHDLRFLINLLTQADEPEVDRFVNLVDLTDFAVEFRYEIFDEEPLNRNAVLTDVQSLMDHVQKLLKEAETAG